MSRFDEAFARQEAKESGFDWLRHYRDAARLTHNLSQHDPRFGPVLEALSAMDMAYTKDVTAFVVACGRLRDVIDGKESDHEQTALTL